MIFVDTGPWFARMCRSDESHAVAVDWFNQNREPLVTTDYVIDEVLTLLQARGRGREARAFGAIAFAQMYASLVFITPDDVLAAWDVFLKFDDKLWSFTDCTSKVVMGRMGIRTACSFDHHFRQFGQIDVVP